MSQRKVFKVEGEKKSGVNEIVLDLGDGVEARLENQKDNVVDIFIFREGEERKKPKMKVTICTPVNDEGLHYKFVFNVGKGLNFMTTGLEKIPESELEESAIKAEALVYKQ